MSIIGIVCEYNPFHNGHEYQIKKSRETVGEDAGVVCVMSGDFVQRGEAAAFSKFARAEAACRCGADLVIELPLPWALSSAENFARGAVSLLRQMRADYLSFGSEQGEIQELEHIADAILADGFQESVMEILSEKEDISYAAARQRALEERLGSEAELIKSPNNILAVEYLKAIRTLGAGMKPITIRREGAAHDGDGGEGRYRSASALRELLRKGENIAPYVPEKAREVYENEIGQGRIIRQDKMETAVLSRLRMFEAEYFERMRDAGNGAGRRLYEAVRHEAGLDGILNAAKTRRYPLARMRRIAMCAALGIEREAADGVPGYARVLAANGRGCALLAQLRGKTEMPLITKPASAKRLDSAARKVFALGASAHDLYVLGFEKDDGNICGNDWRSGPRIV